MKNRRIATLALAALLTLGVGGGIAMKSLAQGVTPPAAVQAGVAQDQEQAVNAPDTDTVEEQVGDQNEAEDAVGAADTDTVEEQVGDQNAPDNGQEAAEAEEANSADGQDAVPTGTPAITAEAAQAAAEAHLNAGTASQVELDDENGQLVYSVQIGASDVKVDAMTGTVLGVESDAD